jgi:hypothetical protein
MMTHGEAVGSIALLALIFNLMQPTEEQIDTAARMLAAAYWRGRLHDIATISPHTDSGCVENMIAAAAEKSIGSWRCSARALLSMVRDQG